ncbi:hypothetical protein [uncultured Lacinutrix sp.]|uniref:hypothetical protein n=1 Tax=uncultured Lacinutrix sp. TaxID=574032 RepID=UPI002616CE8C|nr:hypothetical protein [uncultured Lacinutrix sp.]
MKLDQIISFLETNSIPFQVNSTNTITSYKPASLKNVIENGIYFIMGDINISNINNSIIFTSEAKNESINATNISISVTNPQLTHYKLCGVFAEKRKTNIHETAIIDKDAVIGNNVYIGPYCVLEKCVIGDNVVLNSHVVIYNNTEINDKVFIDSNSCIGASGLAWIWDEDGNRIMQPQLGGVIVEADCHIATDVTIVKGSLSENTCIGKGTVIAHGTKIGHGAQVGTNVHMANNVSLAGNAEIGDRTFLGSASIISSNIKIPHNTIVGAGAMVNKNFDEEFCTLAGIPAKVLKRENYKNKPKGAPKPFN